MPNYRLKNHPILQINRGKKVHFFWKNRSFTAFENETIASALIANGIYIFGKHPKDKSPQGIFCANGQCAQCLILVNGKPVKSCMEKVREGIHTSPLENYYKLPQVKQNFKFTRIHELTIPILIIGGGPAGLSAAIELGKLGIKTILIDDKNKLGGKLILQTHRFFGSSEAVFAGMRGIDIAQKLEGELREYPDVDIWLNSTALAVFSDKKIGILKNNKQYILVNPKIILVASGARERFLSFPGNTLPGIFGAGAFQTLVNRDFVLPSQRLFIIGGGNVGLIAGYHALQANVQVAGLAEIMPECSGYKVHKDKLSRLGVPIYTSHTIISANGKDRVKSVTIAKVNKDFHALPKTERTIDCDSLLIAVGLKPINEFLHKAREFHMKAFVAGDADEIAEASAAIFSGKIRAWEIARTLGIRKNNPPREWKRIKNILKSKPGKGKKEIHPKKKKGVYPVFHCIQEIPCDPCAHLCPLGLIHIDKSDIRKIPQYIPNDKLCIGCGKCVIGCPGLAITLVDYRKSSKYPTITIPTEFFCNHLNKGQKITTLDTIGNRIGKYPIADVISKKQNNHTNLIKLIAPASIAEEIAGIQIQEPNKAQPHNSVPKILKNEEFVCRCERVTASKIRELVKKGIYDLNEIKIITRAGMGACGGKTCESLILQIFKQENVPFEKITAQTKRPLSVEVPLEHFAGCKKVNPKK